MILTTQSEIVFSRLGYERAVKALCEAGFDAIDLSMFGLHKPEHPYNGDDFKTHLDSLLEIANSYGIPFRQSHAPFPSRRLGDDEYNEITYKRIVRALEVSAYVGAKIMVVHPTQIPDADYDTQKQYNLEFYRSFQPLCEKLGVKIALENMWRHNEDKSRIFSNVCSFGAELLDYARELDSRYFTICLDLGHSGLVGEKAADAIRAIGGEYLGSLHVHDNDFVHDSHTAPYYGKMDWSAITKALHDIDYGGDFTFECDHFLKLLPDELLPSGEKFIHDIGRHLIGMIEKG